MAHHGIDDKTWNEAIKALKITIPVRAARKLKDGSIELVTRDGPLTYKPPKPRPKKN